MKISRIKKSWMMQNSFRIDAPFHLSEGVLTLLKIKEAPYNIKTLDEVTKRIFFGNIFKRTFVNNSKNGVPYLTGSDMIKSNLDTGRFLSRKLTKKQSDLMIDKEWILLSCSGTIGNVVFTNQDFHGRIGTHDLIRIIPESATIYKGYLYAFLASKHGYNLLTQSNYGGVVKHIEPNQIRNLPIPIFSDEKQQKIHNLIVEAADLRVEANRLKEHSKMIILKDLHVQKYKGCGLNGRMNIKTIKNSPQKRIDSIAYLNNGVRYINELKKVGVDFTTIKDLNIKVRRPGIFKRVYVLKENGFPYFKGSELILQNPFSNCVFLSKTKTPFQRELKLVENQILFTCAGTVGNTRLITKEFEERNAIGSQDIIRIESGDSIVTSQYLYAYLNISFVNDYVQSLKYGSVIERVEPFHVESIPVMIPSKGVSRKVTKAIMLYSDAIYKSFKKEQEAIELVEKEIDSWQN